MKISPAMEDCEVYVGYLIKGTLLAQMPPPLLEMKGGGGGGGGG